ncbi:MAG: BON domain-containing protein [Acidobacteriota bacterium]
MSKKKRINLRAMLVLGGLLLAMTTASRTSAGQSDAQTRETKRLVREIRHELLTLPWYGVFDWLEGSVTPDGRVTLRGWVTRPTTRSEAEARMKEIESVLQVNNEIKVLAVSPNDDRLRRAVYAALFNENSPLFRYALGANPSIHIIVENGRVTLKGSVSSESDKNIATIKASGVSGVLDIANDLTVDRS